MNYLIPLMVVIPILCALIVNVIGETVEIVSHIVPLYNFKASE